MVAIINDLIFLLISLYILFSVIGYSIYEIKQMNNKVGGIIIITLSIIIVIFSNFMVITN